MYDVPAHLRLFRLSLHAFLESFLDSKENISSTYVFIFKNYANFEAKTFDYSNSTQLQ